MKTILIAILATVTFTIGVADARDKSLDFIAKQKDGMRFYKMTCIAKAFCGNWNVTN